jgi:hypothetical protein
MFGSWLGGSGGCASKDELSSALIDLSEEIMAQVGSAVFAFKLGSNSKSTRKRCTCYDNICGCAAMGRVLVLWHELVRA